MCKTSKTLRNNVAANKHKHSPTKTKIVDDVTTTFSELLN
ncbi:hypothetical protein L798_02602 [Zootermopsis nevadensis]|uniref:Uncharacterized protein n=1 Tax=Zootermopsis nevadensis TaxID=136037 RepID=A0A067RMH2_ZOONE|nr:hypothetical protein L798_02602 [Zootermopsis nevadensis]